MLGAMALGIDQWNVEVRPWGWLRLREQSGGGPSVFLHYQLAGPSSQERLELQSVVMRSGRDEALSGRIWRRIPLSQIEETLTSLLVQLPFNAPTESTALRAMQARESFMEGSDLSDIEAPPTLDELDRYFDATEDIATVFFNPIPSSSLVSDGGEGLPTGKVPQITPPEGRITDDFLGDVAEAYRWFTEAKRPPAPAISEISGAPVRTVHRWIYEARKRGILPPARTGRAG
ncbi:hypothetical protein ABZ027_08400 [Streptomyces sp. NPDC006332]|uniref:hypothetical protein n=1 Tax=Streptomyces sp. NPDC006332 TaxID=3155456 RepID=UPI0033B327AE